VVELKTASGHVIKPQVVKAISRQLAADERMVRLLKEITEDVDELTERQSDRAPEPAVLAEVST